MRRRYAQLGAAAIVGMLGAASWAGPIAAQPDAPLAEAQPEALAAGDADEPRNDRLLAADRLMSDCLRFQREVRGLRDRLRGLATEMDRRQAVLEQAAAILDKPADADAAAYWRAAIDQAASETAQIRRWLRGDDRPEEAGLTRAMLRLRLESLDQTRRDAALYAHACELDDPADRADLRRRVLAESRDLRRRVQETTQPMRDRLDELEQYADAQGDTMREVMGGMGRTTDEGPVPVMAVATTGFFMHGHVSYRWTDRRGQLVASAQVRLLPHADDDTTPPLLGGRFPILAQTHRGAELHVGHFSVDFHVNVADLESPDLVLATLARLLDLEALAKVRPAGVAPGQN